MNICVAFKRCFSSCVSKSDVRVRFAPSPTGFLHLGGLRTALYNYLFAKSQNGTFILRIEDTDQKRLVDGAIQKLEDDLKWAGVEIDEGPSRGGSFGPYLQSKRLDIYKKEVDYLIGNGHAYPCFCTDRRLDLIRKDAVRRKEIAKYDNHCRHLSAAEVHDKISSGVPHCIRFKLMHCTDPWIDIIHGPIVQNVASVEGDPIILKTDGFPTYHLANVIDDHYMQISHVLRGIEWQSSTAKHVLLYKAFNWDVPKLAHLPLLTNESGSKLSKRDGSVTVEEFKNNLVYPKALINVLTLCGGGFKSKVSPDLLGHLCSIEYLSENFSLDIVNSNNCTLPIGRIRDFNQMCMKEMINDNNTLIELSQDAYKLIIEKIPQSKETLTIDKVKEVLQWAVSKGRIFNLNNILENDFLYLWSRPTFTLAMEYDNKVFDIIPPLIEHLKTVKKDELKDVTSWLKNLSEEKELQYSIVMKFLRACLSGLKKGPGVSEMLTQLGLDESIIRLQELLNFKNSK